MSCNFKRSASILALALASGLAMQSPADANGTSYKPAVAPLPQATMWEGWYVGGHLGYGEADFAGRFDASSAGDINLQDPDGILGGMHIGRNWQNNTFVFGLEADLSATGGWDKELAQADTTCCSEVSHGAVHSQVELLASLRGRLGMAFDHTLLYVTGGLAFTDASVRTQFKSSDSTSLRQQRLDFDKFGGVLGLGAEMIARDKFSVRVEGLYYIFDANEKMTINNDRNAGLNDIFVIRAGATHHFSDIRLKRDIALLARLDNGLGLYRYRYLWSEQVYVGVMAQEVAKVVPDAVVRGADGYLRVDYAHLGLRLLTYDEWTESSKAEFAIAA